MTDVDTRAPIRERIVGAAAELLRRGGSAAVTTRAVADAAGIQAPTIYRLFGDKDGLLEAVAEHVMAVQVAGKAEVAGLAVAAELDPVEDLRAGWASQIEFGLANPDLFRLLSDPERVARSPAARSGRRILEARIERIAAAGRLRVDERRAVDMVQAAGLGTISALLAAPRQERDPGLADAMLDVVLSRILVGTATPADDGPVRAAITLRAFAPRLAVLSEGERSLLTEWLDRVARADRLAPVSDQD